MNTKPFSLLVIATLVLSACAPINVSLNPVAPEAQATKVTTNVQPTAAPAGPAGPPGPAARAPRRKRRVRRGTGR